MGLLTGLFQNEYPYTDLHELNLSWVIVQVKNLLDAVKVIDGWIDNHQKEYEELQRLYDNIVSGKFPPEMYKALHDWVVANAQSIVGEIIKSVFFGLENGYFVAYIPDSWSEIIFGTTGLDDFPIGFDFGHLTLTY